MHSEESPSAFTSDQSNLEEFSQLFLKLLQDVIECLDQQPNALEILKKALASLVIPLGEGKVASLVDPSLYSDATTVNEVFASLSPHLNPLSLDLLQCLVILTDCKSAIEGVSGFNQLRLSMSHLILCSSRWTVPAHPCLLYTSPSPRDATLSRMPSSA